MRATLIAQAQQSAHARFDELVAGKTVAIVGPATPDGDQSAEIDSHDLVVRFEWFGECPPGMGSRCDIVYYNRSMGRRMKPGSIPPGVLWACFREAGHCRAENHRPQRVPPGLDKPNLVPISAFDMTLAGAARVTIYGANFYLDAQPYYSDSYLPGRLQRVGSMRLISHTVSSHDQLKQRRFLRQLMAEHPQITGDDRFLRILAMDDADYFDALGRLWNVRSRQPARRRSAKGPRTMAKKNTWCHVVDGRVRKVPADSQLDRAFRRNPDWKLWDDLAESRDDTDDQDLPASTAGDSQPETDPEPDAPATQDDEHGDEDDGDLEEQEEAPSATLVHTGAGWYEVTIDGEVRDRVRGREAAEARAAELAGGDVPEP